MLTQTLRDLGIIIKVSIIIWALLARALNMAPLSYFHFL